MGTHSVTLTSKQEAALTLGENQTVADFCQRVVDGEANAALQAKLAERFADMDATNQEAALVAQEAKIAE